MRTVCFRAVRSNVRNGCISDGDWCLPGRAPVTASVRFRAVCSIHSPVRRVVIPAICTSRSAELLTKKMQCVSRLPRPSAFDDLFGLVADLFGVDCHLQSTMNYRAAARFREWRSIADVPAAACPRASVQGFRSVPTPPT